MSHTIYVIATGGGTGAIPQYLTRGGASAWFAGMEVPYGMPMFNACCNGEVWGGKLVSERAAHQLAAEASRRAELCGQVPVGIGLTASLCKPTGEREGRINEVYIAVICDTRTAYTIHRVFTEDEKDRGYQESACTRLLQQTIDHFIGKNDHFPYTSFYNVDDELDDDSWHVRFNSSKVVPVFPGSFNPFHSSHLEIYGAIVEQYGVHPVLDISLTHENKPGISPYEFHLRREWIKSQFMWANPIVRASHHPLMIDKAGEYKSMFPDYNIVFAMGADVYERIDPDHRKHLNIFAFNRGLSKIQPAKNLVVATPAVPNMSSTELRKKGEWPTT